MAKSWLKQGATSAFLMLITFSISANINPFQSVNKASDPISFLPVNQAFQFNFSQQENKVLLQWDISPDYYLYQNKIKVIGSDNTQIADINYPQSILYQDEFFGEVGIYKKNLTLEVNLLKAEDNSFLNVHYQGCAVAGFCYPPEIIQIPLSAITPIVLPKTLEAPEIVNLTQEPQALNPAKELDLKTANSENLLTDNTEKPSAENIKESTNKVSSLAENWWQPLLFLALGIGLAFTPCVLPMYPILTGILLGGGKLSHRETFRLAFLYVQGMALTYTLLGLVVASAGLQFQAALQNPIVLISLSGVFILLATSMFGGINLQLPARAQTYLCQLSNQQKGGNSLGVFTMGAISGLICSPCTTAPLSGALLYVAQSGDLLTGAVTLYALALGMGIPLILAALFGNKLLPKAGSWMDSIKTFFGFVLLAAALFLIERILAPALSTAMWLGWLFVISTWLLHISRLLPVRKLSTLLASLAILGISTSALIAHQTYLAPIERQAVKVNFIQITSLETLNQELAKAKAANKAVMLDFYADWCVACKEFEKYTFHEPKVANELDKFVLLQADVTDTTAENMALLKQLQVLGLPTIDFWQTDGSPMPAARLTGFVKAEPFLLHLKENKLIH